MNLQDICKYMYSLGIIEQNFKSKRYTIILKNDA